MGIVKQVFFFYLISSLTGVTVILGIIFNSLHLGLHIHHAGKTHIQKYMEALTLFKEYRQVR